MKTKIGLNLATIRHQQSGLGLSIHVHNKCLFESMDVKNSTINLVVEVELPCIFEFCISGRKLNDTIIDDSNNVIADKAFHLEHISFDGFTIESWRLPKTHLFLECEDLNIRYGPYWASNGTAKLIIDNSDYMLWMLDHKKSLIDGFN